MPLCCHSLPEYKNAYAKLKTNREPTEQQQQQQINQIAGIANDWNETRKKGAARKKFPNNQVIILITNHIDLAAQTAAATYIAVRNERTNKRTRENEKKKRKITKRNRIENVLTTPK